MKKFITQFRKAKERGHYLIYDKLENRYLVTGQKCWCSWYGVCLIKKFVKP